MGKVESNRSSRECTKPLRKSLVGEHSVAVILKPLDLAKTVNGCAGTPSDMSAASELFDMMKEANRRIVKGSKLFESLSELSLIGWLRPSTLLLSGPHEDLRILKHFWTKRLVKSPLGFLIKDLAIVKDFLVESVPQSQFMSLTTALFDSIADLNQQAVFPGTNVIIEYLRKHYPDLQTPESSIINSCLSRLVRDKKVFHNGRGFFILYTENVLNDMMKSQERASSKICDPALFGSAFQCSSPIMSNSSTHEDACTDVERDERRLPACHNKSTELQADVTSSAWDSAGSTPLAVKKFLTRQANVERKAGEKARGKGRLFSCGIAGTATDSCADVNGANEAFFANQERANGLNVTEGMLSQYLTPRSFQVNLQPSRYPIFESSSVHCDGRETQPTAVCSADYCRRYSDDELGICKNQSPKADYDRVRTTKPRRSKSFGGSDSAKLDNDVSFALVGSPCEPAEGSTVFKRSSSIGRAHLSRPRRVCDSDSGLEDLSPLRTFPLTGFPKYSDIRNSFIDDSLPEMGAFLKANGHDALKSIATNNISCGDKAVSPSPALDRAVCIGKPSVIAESSQKTLSKKSKFVSELGLAYDYATDVDDGNSVTCIFPVADPLEADVNDRSIEVERRSGSDLSAASAVSQASSSASDPTNVTTPPDERRISTSEKDCHGLNPLPAGVARHDQLLRPSLLKTTGGRRRGQRERNSKLFEEKRASMTVIGLV